MLNIERSSVKNIDVSVNNNREKLISEIMKPAILSNEWQYLKTTNINISDAMDGIEIIEATSQRDEAIAIACKMREILETPEKTVALVTYDRNLARRVSAELGRFDIKVDDSAGIPASLTSIGMFLRLIAEASLNIDSDVAINALLKSPYTLFGENSL